MSKHTASDMPDDFSNIGTLLEQRLVRVNEFVSSSVEAATATPGTVGTTFRVYAQKETAPGNKGYVLDATCTLTSTGLHTDFTVLRSERVGKNLLLVLEDFARSVGATEMGVGMTHTQHEFDEHYALQVLGDFGKNRKIAQEPRSRAYRWNLG